MSETFSGQLRSAMVKLKALELSVSAASESDPMLLSGEDLQMLAALLDGRVGLDQIDDEMLQRWDDAIGMGEIAQLVREQERSPSPAGALGGNEVGGAVMPSAPSQPVGPASQPAPASGTRPPQNSDVGSADRSNPSTPGLFEAIVGALGLGLGGLAGIFGANEEMHGALASSEAEAEAEGEGEGEGEHPSDCPEDLHGQPHGEGELHATHQDELSSDHSPDLPDEQHPDDVPGDSSADDDPTHDDSGSIDHGE